MELLVHMYPWEWDQSEGATYSDRVDAWLDLFEDCGFTAIAVTERLDYVWNAAACNGTPFVMRQIDGHTDSILDRIEAHSGGFKVILRQQTAIHNNIAGTIATEYGDGVFGPRIAGESVRGLSPYEPRSIDLLRAHAARLTSTIYDAVDWVEIGWTSSGECDDVRGFINRLNTPVKTFRTDPQFVTRAAMQRESVTSPREIRLDDAHMAMGKLWAAALSVFGAGKPIGLLRGSCWHEQQVRRNLPFFPGETLAQVNDVNQTSNEWCIAAGFTQPYQTNALAFSCDILRGSGIGFLINAVDGMKVNFILMDPPPLPHSQPSEFDGSTPPLDFQGEVYLRAKLCVYRGVSFMVTHFRYSSNQHLPADVRTPPFLINWVPWLDSFRTSLAMAA